MSKGQHRGRAQLSNLPHTSSGDLDFADLDLSVEDAEELLAQAAVLRASAVEDCQPLWRARRLAEAVALETVAAKVVVLPRTPKRGNGGELALKVSLDAPWNQREVARATSDAPDLLNAEASVARLKLAHDADALTLAVDTAQRSGATTPAEQMLAHQMATAHSLAMKLAAKSQMFLERRFLSYKSEFGGDNEARREQAASIEAGRLAIASARMMEATARAAIVLDRLRNGTTQTIIVQQKVDVQSGAQAVVNGTANLSPRRVKPGRRMP